MRLEAVGKRYGVRQPWVVRDVSLDIATGRLIRVEGRNGTGKSTLLRVVAGVCVPTRGKMLGRPSTGYVPERFPAGLPFQTREYLTHLGRIHGLRGAGLTVRFDECLEQFGATDFAGSSMRSLSKGMCQKVAIAQALLARPDLLVLDEAWTGLDVAARFALDTAVAQRVAAGGTVLFVDHDPRRLAGQFGESWQIDAGKVTVRQAAAHGSFGQERTTAGLAGPDVASAELVRIEAAGLPARSISELAGLPGVRSAMPEQDRAVILVAAAQSDFLLRLLLSEGAGILAVRPEPGAGT